MRRKFESLAQSLSQSLSPSNVKPRRGVGQGLRQGLRQGLGQRFGGQLMQLALLGVLLLTGCLGYRLGPTSDLGNRTVAVPMFRNATTQPQLEAQVTNGIIKGLQRDGSIPVAHQETADLIVRGVITRYKRAVLRTERDDSSSPREYRVTITAEVEVFDQRTQKPLLEKTEFTGQADTFISTDLQSADYQALPLAAEDLARKIVTLLTERWE